MGRDRIRSRAYPALSTAALEPPHTSLSLSSLSFARARARALLRSSSLLVALVRRVCSPVRALGALPRSSPLGSSAASPRLVTQPVRRRLGSSSPSMLGGHSLELLPLERAGLVGVEEGAEGVGREGGALGRIEAALVRDVQ